MTVPKGRTKRILVVDDDRATRAMLQRVLTADGYDVVSAENGLEAQDKLNAHAYQLVLTDWSMPEMDGQALVQWLRQRATEEYIYVIVLTGEKDNLTQAFEAGADDYVTKPFDREELLARLRVGNRILKLQASMREAERRLRQIADRDGLTDLLNRRALDARLAEAFSYFQRRGRPLSIALLDLDHFKHVNDAFGHPAGDAVLRETARRVPDAVRTYDTLGRYGGEEFLLILPDTVAWSARLVAERVRQVIGQTPVVFEERIIQVTGSVGVVTVGVGFQGELSQVVAAADTALYDAKRRGRNRVVSISLADEGAVERPPPTLDLVGP